MPAGEEVSDPVEDEDRDGTVETSTKKKKGRVKKRKEMIITPFSPTFGKHSGNGELGAIDLAQNQAVADPGAVLKAGKGRGGVNHLAGKEAAHKSRAKNLQSGPSGDSGAKKPFTWSSAQEIIALSELAKFVTVDAGQPVDSRSIHWEQLAGTVGKRLDCDLTRIQMYEKARRLKERYSSVDQKISEGKLNSFKNADEEKIYNLSQQIWGNCGALRLHLEEEEEEEEQDLLPGKLEKRFRDAIGSHKDDSQEGLQDEIPELNMEQETAASEDLNHPLRPEVPPSQGHEEENAAGESSEEQIEKTVRDLALKLRTHAMEGDTQRTFEVFHAEHQALLKELQKSCEGVLEEMQAKFLIMINNAVKAAGGSHAPPPLWMGGGRCMPQLDFMRPAVLGDNFVDEFLPATRPQGANKPVAFGSFKEQWQQKRLEELKLTSLKLQLMLEECKIEQEKLERQINQT